MYKTVGALLIFFSLPVFSQVSLWDEDSSSQEIPPVFEDTISSVRINLNRPELLTLVPNDTVVVTLESDIVKTAMIDVVNTFDGVVQIIGRLTSEKNSVIEIQVGSEGVSASVLLNQSSIGYRLETTKNDVAFLLKQELGEFLCVGMPPEPDYSSSAELYSSSTDQPLATVSTVPLYNSKLGASKVIYLDFDGETVAGTVWNSFFNNGAPIFAQPFDQDGSPTTFNDSEQLFIKNVWERTKEAFSIYEVNVTTDVNKFNSASVSNRQRMLISPTDNWYGSVAGGVALRPSFGQNVTAWGFTAYGSGRQGANMGLISIHEIGHTLGLPHHGLNGAEYHPGQSGWGPFMGAPYDSSYTTFSNGDYSGSTQNIPDLSIISNKLPFVSDSVGNNNSSSTNSTLDTEIENQIGALDDRDVYQFQANEGDRIVINTVALGDFPTINIETILYSSDGSLIASNDLVPTFPLPIPASKSLNSKITFRANQTGLYYLHVRGNGYNGGANYNHSSYGAVGHYSLSVSLNDLNIIPIIIYLLDEDEEL